MTINVDKTSEGNESFSLSLLFDEFVSYEVRTQVNIQPSVVHVNILDVTRELIFKSRTRYSTICMVVSSLVNPLKVLYMLV